MMSVWRMLQKRRIGWLEMVHLRLVHNCSLYVWYLFDPEAVTRPGPSKFFVNWFSANTPVLLGFPLYILWECLRVCCTFFSGKYNHVYFYFYILMLFFLFFTLPITEWCKENQKVISKSEFNDQWENEMLLAAGPLRKTSCIVCENSFSHSRTHEFGTLKLVIGLELHDWGGEKPKSKNKIYLSNEVVKVWRWMERFVKLPTKYRLQNGSFSLMEKTSF